MNSLQEIKKAFPKSKLKFYTRKHKYVYDKKQELISVTTWIKSFFPKFEDSDAYKNANDYLRKKWAKSGKDAGKAGTETHKQIEDFLSGKVGSITDLKAIKALDFLLNNQKLFGFLPEQRIYDAQLGLAGTADLLSVTEDGNLVLFDWKTNKEIKTKAYDDQTGFGPCSEVQNANYYHYMLQLSTYSYILARAGFKVKECTVVHLKEDSYVAYNFEPNLTLVAEMLNFKNGKKLLEENNDKTKTQISE